MNRFLAFIFLSSLLAGCNTDTSPRHGTDGSLSEIATEMIGGVVNDSMASAGGDYALNLPKHQPSFTEKFFSAFDLLPTAFAYLETCTGGSMSPGTYNVPATSNYSWTPTVCTLTYHDSLASSTSFSGTYNYNYSNTCKSAGAGGDFPLSTQPNGCVVTRTTPNTGSPVGVTRTVTGAQNIVYAVTHDTNNPAGYDNTIATNANGEVITCTYDNCGSRNITIGGSQITATVGGNQALWNATVTTDPANPLLAMQTGPTRMAIRGTIVVQDNVNKITGKALITYPLIWSNQNCCFPTVGPIQTTISGGDNNGLVETINYSSDCGEASVTEPDGVIFPLTLMHCL